MAKQFAENRSWAEVIRLLGKEFLFCVHAGAMCLRGVRRFSGFCLSFRTPKRRRCEEAPGKEKHEKTLQRFKQSATSMGFLARLEEGRRPKFVVAGVCREAPTVNMQMPELENQVTRRAEIMKDAWLGRRHFPDVPQQKIAHAAFVPNLRPFYGTP